MYKEIIIIITILLLIITLNYITQKYTKFCVSEISSDLNNLRSKIEEKIDTEELPKELNDFINFFNNQKIADELTYDKNNLFINFSAIFASCIIQQITRCSLYITLSTINYNTNSLINKQRPYNYIFIFYLSITLKDNI